MYVDASGNGCCNMLNFNFMADGVGATAATRTFDIKVLMNSIEEIVIHVL